MKRRHITGRLLAALLCIVLIGTMIPVFASAALKAPKMKKVANVEKGVKITWKASSGAAGYRVFRKPATAGASWKAIGETTTKRSFIDTGAKSGHEYVYAVRALNSAGRAKSGFSANPLKITYYKTPKMKSAETQKNGVLVKWSASAGAPLYRIYRSLNGGSWKAIDTTTKTQYLDKNVKYGRTYSYRVRVVSADNKTLLSDYDHTPVTTTFAKASEIKDLTNRAADIRVRWYKVKGATQYRLFRKIGEGDWFTMTTTTGTTYIDTDVKNNLTYTYYVRAMDAAGEYIGTYHAGKSIVYHVMPTLNACVRSGGNLLVTWEAVEGVSNYVIYRRIGGGEWIKVGTSTTTSYSDSTMPSGTWCEYTVACADGSGSPISDYGVYVVGATSYLAKPVLTGVSNGMGRVIITWNSVDKAQKYIIYRKIGDDVPLWTPIGTTTGTSFADTAVEHCKKYTYTVAVRNAADTEDESMYDETGKTITYYNAPAIGTIAVTNATAGAKITWEKVDGVPNYKIWRKTGNEAWTAIATVHGANSGYSYIDTTVVNNGHYWYSVSCVADSESAFPTPGKETTFYAAPQIDSLAVGDGTMIFKWAAVESITAYRVQRKVAGGSWTTVSASQSDRTYTDTDVTSGTKYAYRVCSLQGGNPVSGWRDVSAKTYLDAPVGVKATKAGKGEMKISWDVAIVGADSHDIYAQTYPGGSWVKVASASKIDTSFLVKGLISGQKYRFKVVAVCSGSQSVDSNNCSGTPN